MAKPVLLTVDDDPEVLRAVERDLRKRYADRYRILRADSGATALRSLETLKRRNESVALLLADQRMRALWLFKLPSETSCYARRGPTGLSGTRRRFRSAGLMARAQFPCC